MKKLIFGCALAVSGLTLPLVANDYGCAAPCDPCGMDFNGFYVGGNLGVISHTAHRADLDGLFVAVTPTSFSTTQTGFTAGVQLGYDWQCCNTLFGLVADWNWTNLRRRHAVLPDIVPGLTFRNEFDWFSTIRARAGLAVCNALVYVTGGAAVVRFNNRFDTLTDSFRNRNSRWGWTGGVGGEWMLGCNWSVGAEVLFLHFNERRRTSTTLAALPVAFSFSDSAWVGRILLNYRFGDLCGCF